MKYLYLLYIIASLALLSACAPKEVAQDTTSEIYYGYTPENNSDMTAHARYPISGNRIQQRLYLLNQPEVQMQIQNSYRSYFERQMGEPLKRTDPNTPKFKSPFVDY